MMHSVRRLLVPLLLLAVGCKTFGADNGEPDASTDAGPVEAPCPNGSLSFDGKAFVNVEPDDAFDSPSDLTVEAWILPDAGLGSTEVHIVSHHDDTNSDGWVMLLDGGLTFRVYSGSGKGSATGGTLDEAKDDSLTLGQWHHVAAVFDGAAAAITLFIDGRSRGRNIGKKTKADPYKGPLRIGAAAYIGGNGFTGLIDEVRVSRVVRYPGATSFKPAYPLPDAEDATIGTWHFLDGKSDKEIANEATGRFTSTLATYATTAPSYPVSKLSTCPTGARP